VTTENDERKCSSGGKQELKKGGWKHTDIFQLQRGGFRVFVVFPNAIRHHYVRQLAQQHTI
jgi:hypothetical protein